MKLHELVHAPIAIGKINNNALLFNVGDLVVTKDGMPGKITSRPDANGWYHVALKMGRDCVVHSANLELAHK